MKTIIKVFSGDLVAKMITMVTTILLIRVMSEYAYSQYTVIVAVTNIFNQIVISSFGKIYIVDNDSLKGAESTLLFLEVVLSLLIALVFLFVQPSIRNNRTDLLFLMFATCIFSYTRVIFQQKCKFAIFTFLEIFRVLIFFIAIGIIVFVYKMQMTVSTVIFFQGCSLVSAMLLLPQKISGLNWRQPIRIKQIMSALLKKEQIYLLVYATLMAVLLQIDILALKTYTSDYYVSAYSSALKYYNMMLMLLSTVNSVLLPKISMEDDYTEIRQIYCQQDKLSLVLLCGVIAAILLAPFVLPIIDGGKYPESIGVFRILCVSALISFWSSPYNNLLIKEKRYFSICIRFAMGIIVSLLGNYILIPLWGINGTALVTLCSYGIVNISSRVHAKHIINKKIRERQQDG